jgi:hypothetical protein
MTTSVKAKRISALRLVKNINDIEQVLPEFFVGGTNVITKPYIRPQFYANFMTCKIFATQKFLKTFCFPFCYFWSLFGAIWQGPQKIRYLATSLAIPDSIYS